MRAAAGLAESDQSAASWHSHALGFPGPATNNIAANGGRVSILYCLWCTPTDYRHTDKYLGLVMVLIALAALGRFTCIKKKVSRSDGRMDRQTDGWTDGRYQVHYLPRFAVDSHFDDNDGSPYMPPCIYHLPRKWYQCISR